ncbi:MAG: asparagine synthase (glutamine-hydrolyzing), partial [Myxococcales bacterium]|nr:asparagine synthase (glutamine-hydrolyzing) [Myxococcales bacterium]
VFNGEIYNHVELRAELEAEGVVFASDHSDTEVLLHLYRRHGADLVHKLDGMFAFVLHDAANRRVLAARDPFGIKPLYLARDGERVALASEIKALLRHPALPARAAAQPLAEYFLLQFVLDDETLFEGVEKLRPGHLLSLDLDRWRVHIEPWWAPDYTVDPRLDEDAAVEALRPLLQDAVRRQVRSDVPVGTWLSGGLDSSLVTALAAPHLGPRPVAFHGLFPDTGAAYSEQAHARSVAHHVGAELVEVPIGPDGLDTALPCLMSLMDEPAAGPGLYPQFRMAQAARAHVTVVLGGQGGDELFGGYTRYLVAYLEQALKGGILGTHDEGEHVATLHSIVPNLRFLQGYEPLLQHLWRDGLFGPMEDRYFRLLDRTEGALELFAPELRARLEGPGKAHLKARFDDVFHRPDTASYLSKMRAFDRIASLPALLHVEDRVTMAVGLESRVPLLDRHIARLLDRLPPRVVFAGGQLKRLLRRAAAPWLPASVVERQDKMGFPFPLNAWLAGPHRDFVADTLLSTRARQRGLFEPAAVEALVAQGGAFSRKLWGLLCVELWFRAHIDPPSGDPP